jgi:hypothetical protein
MITETPRPEGRTGMGGTALLLVIATATIVTVAAEAAFIHWATWALLPVIVLAVVVIAAAVVIAVSRLIDSGDTPSGGRTAHGH